MIIYCYSTNILDGPSPVIVQQCNCTSRSAKGLSADIIARYPYADFYSKRTEPSEPGTFEVREGEKTIIALYAQYYPGAPRENDTAEQRKEWFEQCLENLGSVDGLTTVAFPDHIGCGLAKGNWQTYEKMLIDFAASHPALRIYLVSRDPPPPVDDTFEWKGFLDFPQLASSSSSTCPSGWEVCWKEIGDDIHTAIASFLDQEEADGQTFYPPRQLIYNAFNHVPPSNVKVLLLGLDPYINPGQAMGLSFSVPDETPLPPSLLNIFKELCADGFKKGESGNLTKWADQGVLLLNAALTVRQGVTKSHFKEWQEFTKRLLRYLDKACPPFVAILWGRDAQKVAGPIIGERHRVIESAHPSPLSAANGFFGSHPFSKCNRMLEMIGRDPVDWNLA